MQLSGLTQAAEVLALGPRCSTQPGHAQEGPHPQVDGVTGEAGYVLSTPSPGHVPNGEVGLEESLSKCCKLAGDAAFMLE